MVPSLLGILTKSLAVVASTSTLTTTNAVRPSLATTRLVVRETRVWHGRNARGQGQAVPEELRG